MFPVDYSPAAHEVDHIFSHGDKDKGRIEIVKRLLKRVSNHFPIIVDGQIDRKLFNWRSKLATNNKIISLQLWKL